jgi:hypothetical protein
MNKAQQEAVIMYWVAFRVTFWQVGTRQQHIFRAVTTGQQNHHCRIMSHAGSTTT